MPQMSLGNGYTIDLADGWTFVHALQDAQNQIREGYEKNIIGGSLLKPPGKDQHSGNFVSSMGKDAAQVHHDWYTSKMTQLTTMIQNMTGILQQYGIAETANTIQWKAAETYDPNGDNSDVPRGRHGAV